MDASILEALGMLSPEELEQAFTPYELQMQMAEALRKPSGKQHSTGWGAALGGLGDAVGNVSGAYFQKKAGNQMQADMLARANALRASRGNPQQAAGVMRNTGKDLDPIRALLAKAQQPAQPAEWPGVPFPLPY